jgi:S-(hydroxymethyl)glutathione dehydrogenase/alcohol dehydrogenase
MCDMRAAIFQGIKQPLLIDEIEIDDPIGREVRVRTAACGVCHSDLHVIEGDLPMLPPIVLGHEAAGVVEAVGPQVHALKPGDHVIACLTVACGSCDRCLTGKPHLCYRRGLTQRGRGEPPRLRYKNSKIEAFTDIGGFAEALLVHESALVKVNPELPLEKVALIGCGVVTGVGAVLNTARVEAGSTVAIFGCGAIGLAAVQGAQLAAAARIIAIDKFEHKLALARQLGATDTIDAAAGDPLDAIRALTPAGVDYAFECIGLKLTAEQAFKSLKPGGIATVVGILPWNQKVELESLLLLGERKLQGCFMGSTRFQVDAPRYLELYRQGRLKLDNLISRRAPLNEVNAAFEAMTAGEVVRTVLTF